MSSAPINAIFWIAGTLCFPPNRDERCVIFATAGLRPWAAIFSSATNAEHRVISYNSCRNRHCPNARRRRAPGGWRNRQAELLPVPYFHVVFYSSAVTGSTWLFRIQNSFTTSYSVQLPKLCSRCSRSFNIWEASIGFLAVLHTWGQNHASASAPAIAWFRRGISPDGSRGIACREKLLPARARVEPNVPQEVSEGPASRVPPR